MYYRKIFSRISQVLIEPPRLMQVVIGPRQVGKTTVITQCLESSKIPFVYSSADDPRGYSRKKCVASEPI